LATANLGIVMRRVNSLIQYAIDEFLVTPSRDLILDTLRDDCFLENCACSDLEAEQAKIELFKPDFDISIYDCPKTIDFEAEPDLWDHWQAQQA